MAKAKKDKAAKPAATNMREDKPAEAMAPQPVKAGKKSGGKTTKKGAAQ